MHYFYTLYLQLQRQILNKGTNSQTVKAILEARYTKSYIYGFFFIVCLIVLLLSTYIQYWFLMTYLLLLLRKLECKLVCAK